VKKINAKTVINWSIHDIHLVKVLAYVRQTIIKLFPTDLNLKCKVSIIKII
jgi:hypothetical protein